MIQIRAIAKKCGHLEIYTESKSTVFPSCDCTQLAISSDFSCYCIVITGMRGKPQTNTKPDLFVHSSKGFANASQVQ